MSGIEPLLASLFATAGTTTAAAGTTAAATTAAASGAAATGAAAAGTVAAGLTAAEIASIAGGVAGLAGTGAQLLAEKPKIPNLPGQVTRDDAQREADLRSDLYRRRGRAATFLTPGGAKGDVSSPSLGAAALLGA